MRFVIADNFDEVIKRVEAFIEKNVDSDCRLGLFENNLDNFVIHSNESLWFHHYDHRLCLDKRGVTLFKWVNGKGWTRLNEWSSDSI